LFAWNFSPPLKLSSALTTKRLECDNKAVFSSLSHFFANQKNAHKQKLCVVRCGGFFFLSLLFIFAAAAAAKWK
jgi:hypothetical protein